MQDPVSNPFGAIASFLSGLRTLPLWILIGLALAGYAILFAPAFGGVNPEPFRQKWGVFVWIDAAGFSILSLARIVDASISSHWAHKETAKARRVLRFVPLHQQCWWHLAKQQDDSFVSQIRIDAQASNTTARPVQIVKLRLIRPKAQLLHADVLLPKRGSPYHSHQNPVPPHETVPVSMHVMVRGELARQGKTIRIKLGITDQYGEEYTLKNLLVGTDDKLCRKRTLLQQLRYVQSLVCKPFSRGRHNIEPQSPVMPWTYDPGPECIGICESILTEERRSYAARGRVSGGLGSLNVGLQSEPNYGWTTAGEIPTLLWERGKGTLVSSTNLERLLRNHDSLGESDKDNLERFLLSQLRKDSPFADVAYFVFLVLHRMGRTVDALRTARTFLLGDKVFGYSNVLGTLSAVISHEHFDIDPGLYPLILDALAGDAEPDFKLREKINLASLLCLDRNRAIRDSPKQSS